MAPKKAEGLTFLVTTNPYEATSAANKKRVRSAAALKSWPERRKRTFDQLGLDAVEEAQQRPAASKFRPTTPQSEAGSVDVKPKQEPQPQPQPQPQLGRLELKQIVDEQLVRPTIETRSTTSETLYAYSSGSENLQASTSGSPAPCTREQTPEIPCRCWRCRPSRGPQPIARPKLTPQSRRKKDEVYYHRPNDLAILTPPASPSPPPPVTNMSDPFNCYPVPYKRWYDGVLHHMLTVFAPRGWPALKISRDQGLKWEWFMTQNALVDPALFYVRLLFGSGDLIRLGVLKPDVSWWLQAKAIESINEALRDPERATSDPLILAVGRIALHESLYGDRTAANTIHRPAQQRMIRMRGGMKALDFPDLVKRLMRWADTVMSKQGGTERFLEDDEETKNFSMHEAVNVLEKWVPTEGRALRKKINISDLVNDEDV